MNTHLCSQQIFHNRSVITVTKIKDSLAPLKYFSESRFGLVLGLTPPSKKFRLGAIQVKQIKLFIRFSDKALVSKIKMLQK